MIYLDHNATTPVLPEVVEAMLPYLREDWGNPSSTYRFGAKLKKVIETAREQVADLIGAHPMDIIFTSGGTESDNTALHAISRANPAKRHIITSVVEHSAVLSYCRYLETEGFRITYLPVDRDGLLSLADLENAITPETAGVSLMWANNETGVLFPVEDLAAICQSRGVLFHCDAVQAAGKVPIDLKRVPIDFLALTGHKIGAPKGIGALFIRREDGFTPFIRGGHQERGGRGGTENVSLIAALGKAANLARTARLAESVRVAGLRDELEQAFHRAIAQAEVNGRQSPRLPNTSNIHLPGMDSDAVVTFMDQRGICISSGSACLESALTPSHVIIAMSGSHDRASESIRVSFGPSSETSDVIAVTEALRALAADAA